MELSKQNIFSIIFFLIFLTNSKNVYVIIIKVPVPLTDKKIGLSHFSLADQNSISEHSILQWGLQLAILGIASRPFG